MAAHGNFFAIDRHVWGKLCSLKRINLAVSYLVLARGTQSDMRTTSWSVKAIEDRTNISRPAAKQAIKDLIEYGFIEKRRDGTKPQYYLLSNEKIGGISGSEEATVQKQSAQINTSSDWIWLPNSIADSMVEEAPPIERLRQTHSIPILRLYIDLYHAQALASDGGVNWNILREDYNREKVAERANFDVYAFWPEQKPTYRYWPKTEFLRTFLSWSAENFGSSSVCDPGADHFRLSVEELVAMGLISFVPHLVTSDASEGTVIHPLSYGNEGEEAEREVAAAAHSAALAMMNAGSSEELFNMPVMLVPVQRHIRHVAVVGLARMRHRANTTATAAWFDRMDEWRDHTARYRAHAEAIQQTGSDPKYATSKGHQWHIKW